MVEQSKTADTNLGVPLQLRAFHSEFECDPKNKDAVSAKRYAAIMKSSQLLIPPQNQMKEKVRRLSKRLGL